MASASAFQAEYAGSIPVSRSNNPRKRIFYLGAGIEKGWAGRETKVSLPCWKLAKRKFRGSDYRDVR